MCFSVSAGVNNKNNVFISLPEAVKESSTFGNIINCCTYTIECTVTIECTTTVELA